MPGKPPPRRGRSGLDDSDRRLWRRAVAGTEPLRRRAAEARIAPDAPALPAGMVADRSAAPPPWRELHPGAHEAPRPVAPSPTPQRLEPGVAAGVDQRTLVRLKRGLIPPETKLDLHHATQEEAHRRLGRFLATSQADGRRCVLVITGKGFGADGRIGVLKAEVPRWLNEPPNRERVLAFCHAPPPWGGEGALFVLLRRRQRRDPR